MIKVTDFYKIPNLLSLLRIILMIPFIFFFYQKNFIITLIIIIIIILTDYLDGWSSRKFSQVTDLGKILDPVADKICLGLGLIVIFIRAKVFLWPVYVLIARDLIIVLTGAIISKKIKKIPVSNFFGKFTSASLSVTGLLFFIVLFCDKPLLSKISYIVYYVAIGFIFLSSVSYLMKTVRMFKDS